MRNQQDQFDRTFNRALKAGIAVWVASTLVVLAILAAIVLVAVHFITKYW